MAQMPIAERPLGKLNKELDEEPLSFTLLYYLQLLITKLKLPCSRNEACSHRGSCLASLIFQSVKNGFIAYGIKFMLGFVFSIKKLLTKKISLLSLFKDKGTINFALFLASFTAVFRMIICWLRRKIDKKNEKYIYMIGGLIGGILSVIFLEKSTRQALGLFLFARALDSSYQSLVKKGYLPDFKYFYPVLYSLSMIATGYCFVNEPGSLSNQTHGFYKSFTNETISEMQMREIMIGRQNIKLAKNGISPQDALDHIPKLKAYYQKIKFG